MSSGATSSSENDETTLTKKKRNKLGTPTPIQEDHSYVSQDLLRRHRKFLFKTWLNRPLEFIQYIPLHYHLFYIMGLSSEQMAPKEIWLCPVLNSGSFLPLPLPNQNRLNQVTPKRLISNLLKPERRWRRGRGASGTGWSWGRSLPSTPLSSSGSWRARSAPQKSAPLRRVNVSVSWFWIKSTKATPLNSELFWYIWGRCMMS